MGSLHHEWLRDASDDIQKNYERLFRQAAEPGRTQEVGHRNESLWKEFLSEWLPPQYEVATRKYIIGSRESKSALFETDLVVFNPGYPRKLRESSHIMAGGVAAAFSTKLTIKAGGFKEAAQESSALSKALVMETGHARLELWKPYVFGILAASHDWKRGRSKPIENVDRSLWDNDKSQSSHPAESLDLVCIADLGTWTKLATFIENPAVPVDGESVLTTHARIHGGGMSPLALFLSALYGMMSWRNPDLVTIANDFRRSTGNVSGVGSCRTWPAAEVLSDTARLEMRGRPLSDANGLDSPMQGNFM